MAGHGVSISVHHQGILLPLVPSEAVGTGLQSCEAIPEPPSAAPEAAIGIPEAAIGIVVSTTGLRGAGSLDQFILKKPSVYQAINVALGICQGISVIHAAGMLQRDLKPANIVMDNMCPQIADFGSVRLLGHGAIDMVASGHSALDRPPEPFDSGRYTLLGDIYQIGLVTYQLLGGRWPYDEMHYMTVAESKAYQAIVDAVDRCKFVETVIHRRAKAGKLIWMTSLPPWIGRSAKNALKAMTDPNPGNYLLR